MLRAEEKKKKMGDSTLPQVPRRVLGKTGETVPILLMGGAMKFDPKFDPKLAEAYRFGVNYVDAADCYAGGQCEGAVGGWLAESGLRKKTWITSKSDQHDPKGFERTLNARPRPHGHRLLRHVLPARGGGSFPAQRHGAEGRRSSV